jgi:N,N-dimethylformamidase
VPSTSFVRSYTDKLSYQPGDVVELFAGADRAVEASVRLVRLDKALGEDAAPPAAPTEIAWPATGSYPVGVQKTCIGSFAHVDLTAPPAPLVEYSLGAWVWCPNPSVSSRQAIISSVNPATSVGMSLTLLDGRAALVAGCGPEAQVLVRLDEPLRAATWYLVVASVTAKNLTLQALPSDPLYGTPLHATEPAPGATALDLSPGVTVGGAGASDMTINGEVARGLAQDLFNGKIEAPFVSTATFAADEPGSAPGLFNAAQDEVVVSLDLTPVPGQPAYHCDVVPAAGTGLLLNGPTRAMISHTWHGQAFGFPEAPDHYAAIHFHDTDIVDAGWEATLAAPLPADLASGVYGLEIRTDDAVDTVPLFVTPAAGAAREKIAVLIPTLSYLAYANEFLFAGPVDFEATKLGDLKLTNNDQARYDGGPYGRSCYDTHTDGSGVSISSSRRPILNLRHDDANWLNGGGRGLSGDMYLIEWLVQLGFDFDVVTDLEVHREGLVALAPYNVVITGAHPEYDSTEMLDAFLQYRDGGGKLMYLGGNGFYWKTAIASTIPLAIEIRRGYAGIRAWESHPGETYLYSTGERGGLWRHNGRPPQELVGVGFCAQGWGTGQPYLRTTASKDPAVEWIFEGVDEEAIGDYGRVLGGAAADELDRFDDRLGTPSGAFVLASAGGHSNHMQRVIEEIPMNVEGHGGGAQDPEVKADMVYFTTPAGGAVFSVGSIGWSGSLLSNEAVNGVSKLTANVLARFAAD